MNNSMRRDTKCFAPNTNNLAVVKVLTYLLIKIQPTNRRAKITKQCMKKQLRPCALLAQKLSDNQEN